MATQDQGSSDARPPFAGYGRPRYTQTPNLFFDEQMQDLSHAETKVLLYIFRRTFGYQQDGAQIKLSDFLHGRRTEDGRQIDRGAGVSENSLMAALRSLEAQRFIFRHQQYDAKDGSQPSYYELNIDGHPHCTKLCSPHCYPSPMAGGPPLPKSGTPPSPNTWGSSPPSRDDPPPPRQDGTLPIDQKKESKRKNPKERIPPPTPSATHIPSASHTKVVVEEGDSDQVREDTDLLVDFGFDEETALSCARLAEANGRLLGYVAEQIEYVRSSPGIQDPIAVLITNIQKNVRRRPSTARRAARPAAPRPPRASVATARVSTEAQEESERRALVQEQAVAEQAARNSAEMSRIWQRAETFLRHALTADEYSRVGRYIHLLELDQSEGCALLGLPNDFMRDQAHHQLEGPIQAALSQVCGTPIRVLIVTMPGQGVQSAPMPTLTALRATRNAEDGSPETRLQRAPEGSGRPDGAAGLSGGGPSRPDGPARQEDRNLRDTGDGYPGA